MKNFVCPHCCFSGIMSHTQAPAQFLEGGQYLGRQIKCGTFPSSYLRNWGHFLKLTGSPWMPGVFILFGSSIYSNGRWFLSLSFWLSLFCFHLSHFFSASETPHNLSSLGKVTMGDWIYTVWYECFLSTNLF